MVKVTRQKTPGNRTISITPSAGRILKRLSEGGYALLLGRTVTSKASAKAKPTIQKISSSKTGPSEAIEIHAVCELLHCPYTDPRGSTDTAVPSIPEDLSSLAVVPQICEIAKSLGLTIVGCGVGTPQPKDHPKKIMWSPTHVISALQLRKLAEETSPFVVVRYAQMLHDAITHTTDAAVSMMFNLSLEACNYSAKHATFTDHSMWSFPLPFV
jgi:hypothetical protein